MLKIEQTERFVACCVACCLVLRSCFVFSRGDKNGRSPQARSAMITDSRLWTRAIWENNNNNNNSELLLQSSIYILSP